MDETGRYEQLKQQYIFANESGESDYLGLIGELVQLRDLEGENWKPFIDDVYFLIKNEIEENRKFPVHPISFGTSGWRGILGKDIFCRSVALVTQAIVNMYLELDNNDELAAFLGVSDSTEAKSRGCVLGYDNRFGGPRFAHIAGDVLLTEGFQVYFAGESTTGCLSAAVLEMSAAFSINLTPSHNPLDYGGFKFNAADGGPAPPEVTSRITEHTQKLLAEGFLENRELPPEETKFSHMQGVTTIDALECWKRLVKKGGSFHGLDLDLAIEQFFQQDDIVVAIDAVHGASRLDICRLFHNQGSERLILLRDKEDVTFGGVAPEPSWENMQKVVERLSDCKEKFKIGAIIDPDGDRIRFTDGIREISMNQFGAMAYHFLFVMKGKKGMVAKTVATSNLANNIAKKLKEEVFEPAVGFKNFKPVIGKALVCFEESDGITIIGHTPEKDAYIGLLLALEMVLVTGKTLGEYLSDIEKEFGACFTARDGVVVAMDTQSMREKLKKLEQYSVGIRLAVGGDEHHIEEVIDIDGRKMVLDNGSWLMIRPSGTEPKIRLYVESNTAEGAEELLDLAKKLLADCGLL